jgi:hypothetical protein
MLVQNPDPGAEVYVIRCHLGDLTRPASGVLQGKKEVPETVTFGVVVENLLPLFQGKKPLPGLGSHRTTDSRNFHSLTSSLGV